MDEFENVRREMRQTSNAFELRINESEREMRQECLDQVRD
jgi:hypothetical protein